MVNEARAKQTIDSIILKDHSFSDVLNMFVHITQLNDTQLALYLGLLPCQVEEIRSGKVFGLMTRDICSKLDQLFDTSNGFFMKVLKKSLLIK